METLLREEHKQSDAVDEFLQHRGNHHGPKAYWIGGDYKERDLPYQRRPDEAVVETGMRERRRILAADQVEHEVKWREDEESPDCCNPEDDLGESGGHA